VLCVVFALFAPACGDSAPSAPSTGSTPPSGTPVNVTGTEKIGWDQPASGTSQLAGYQYLGYVDNVPQVLTNVSCGSASANGAFPCSATLPRMTVGSHTLELAAQELSGSRLIGDRSPAILLNVTASRTTSTTATVADVRPFATYDGLQLVVETLATGLPAPSALAAAPDGRVFIAGRDGNVLVWQNGKMLTTPALRLTDAAQTSDVGLIGLSLDPDFSSNGQVFVAYAAREETGDFVHRVVRLRDTDSVFGQAVTILEEHALYAPLHPPRLRVAADHTVYVTLPAADQATAESYSSYAGKMLRINPDGTTPSSNQAASPVLATGEAVVGGFDWSPITGRLWITGRDWRGRDFITDFLIGARAASTFEAPVDPSGSAFYTQRRIAGFANDLFIGALNGRHLRRVHFSQTDPNRIEITEHLLDGQFGRISDVVVGPDGALYLSTSNKGTTSVTAVDDRLLRVTAAQ